ncbi:MAG TPA: hypothetical protein VM537_02185 [Anaerolineae bacterium]|nr:hypothetical protein [Anaerolineae bacterium]
MTETREVFDAAERDDVRRIAELLAASPSLVSKLGETGFSPLDLAVRYGDVEATALLLDRGLEA